MPRFFVFLVTLVFCAVKAICRSRSDLVLENLALRQQVTTLKQRRPRPPLDDADRGFWVAREKGFQTGSGNQRPTAPVAAVDITSTYADNRLQPRWNRS